MASCLRGFENVKRKLALFLAAALLASCNQADKADERICLTASADVSQGDWGACVHKWAYRLSRAPDPAQTVADATVAACADAIAWQVNNGAEKDASPPERKVLGDQIMVSARELALFHVVQSRAGNCEIP
jgi:hypothetical protein